MRGQKVKDLRKAPQILAWQVLKLVFYNSIFGGRSLLQADQMGRKKEVKIFIGSKRKQIASDTTMHNSLQTMDTNKIREFLRLAYLKGKEKGLICARSGKLNNLRLACVDGTRFGKFLVCGIKTIGKPGILLDIERMPKMGKELPTSRKLLRGSVKRYGKGFVDLFLQDGLYFSHEDINFCLSDAEIHVLIKLKKEEINTLNILKDAEAIFSSQEFRRDIEYISGVDEERNTEYQVWACEGFYLDRCNFPLKVARVQGRHIKKGEDFAFWVVTTLTTLSAEQMCIGGHLRWDIENNGFKMLNAQTNSKHVWTHNEKEWEALTLILLFAFAMLVIFQSHLDRSLIRKYYGGVIITTHFVSRLLYDSIISSYSTKDFAFS